MHPYAFSCLVRIVSCLQLAVLAQGQSQTRGSSKTGESDRVMCPPCNNGTTGPCIALPTRFCFPYVPTTGNGRPYCLSPLHDCGPHSQDCFNCTEGTAGPCIAEPGLCFPFVIGTEHCPTGTTACWPLPRDRQCDNCLEGSQGPCIHPTTGVCLPMSEQRCAHGLKKCWCEGCRFSNGPCLHPETNHCVPFTVEDNQISCPSEYHNCIRNDNSSSPDEGNHEEQESDESVFVAVYTLSAIGIFVVILGFALYRRGQHKELFKIALTNPLHTSHRANDRFKEN